MAHANWIMYPIKLIVSANTEDGTRTMDVIKSF